MMKALKLMSCSCQDTIAFGDRLIDKQASKSTEIQSAACLWGTKKKTLLKIYTTDERK